MKKSKFYPQVVLLLDVLPYVAKESCFALKGGTAINLFVRNFPRLSVDIDLTYLGSEPREDALAKTYSTLFRRSFRGGNFCLYGEELTEMEQLR